MSKIALCLWMQLRGPTILEWCLVTDATCLRTVFGPRPVGGGLGCDGRPGDLTSIG